MAGLENICIQPFPLAVTIEFCLPGVFKHITALFSNMRTLKFKAQPTNAFLTAVNQMLGMFILYYTNKSLPVFIGLCGFKESMVQRHWPNFKTAKKSKKAILT